MQSREIMANLATDWRESWVKFDAKKITIKQ